MGIQHIEDISESKLDSFITNWNEKNVTVTEKIDGSYMTFGLENNEFFLGSKNLMFKRYNEIPDVYFYDDFKKYFRTICKLPLENILTDIEKKYSVKLPRKFEGEAIPSHEHNIICYDLNKIRNGVFVFFKTFEKSNDLLWNDLIAELNRYSLIKFHVLPKIDINFELVTNTGIDIKKQILAELKLQPLFGDDFEGLVIDVPNGGLIKIVDKEKFNKVKQLNWFYINLAGTYKGQFKRKTKKDIAAVKINLEKWLADLEILEKDFTNAGIKTITIKKKKRDTVNYFNHCKNDIIIPMLDRLESESAEIVFQDFLNKKYSNAKPVIKSAHDAIFSTTNSCIPKHLLDYNVVQGLKLIGLEGLSYEVVGNKANDFIGDLDVAISKSDIANKINSKDFWSDIKTHLSKFDNVKFHIYESLQQFHISKPLQNLSGEIIPAVDRFGNTKSELGSIQIDFFVGDVSWMRDILSGNPKDSKYKAVYRNVFLRSIVGSLYWKNKDNFSYGSIMWKDGFKINTVKIDPPKTPKGYINKINKVAEHHIFSSSDQMARFLFGRNTVWDDINSFEKMYDLYLSDRFRYKSFRHVINQVFVLNLVESNLEIPGIIK